MPNLLTQLEHGLLLVAFATGIVACGDDDGPRSPAPLDPPTLQIGELLPAGGPAWPRSACEGDDCSGHCVEFGRDTERTTLVRVELRNWTLQPYLGCGDAPQCGFVLVTVTDPEGEPLRISAPATHVPVELGRLSSPEGSFTFRAELRDGQGKPAEDNSGAPLADEISVGVRALCDGNPPMGDAGVLDAAADAAPEGGQPDGAMRDAAIPDAADAGPAVDAPAEAGAPSDAMDARIVDAAID